MAESPAKGSLFFRDVKTIGKHINNALKEELANVPTVATFAIVQNEGERLDDSVLAMLDKRCITSGHPSKTLARIGLPSR